MLLGLGVAAQPIHAQEAPLFLAHYMPWYQAKPFRAYWGWHWTMGVFRPDETDSSGYPEIASHYHPLIGPYDSSDPAVLEYHALLMHIAGIDGVIVDWYGTSTLYDYPVLNQATQDLFEVTEEIGLTFSICYEDRTLKALVDAGRISAANAVTQAKVDMTFVRDEWTSSTNYLSLQNKPVIFNFGPVYLNDYRDWEEAFTVFSEPPAFATLNNLMFQTGSGAYPWPPMDRSVAGVLSPESLNEYLTAFYAKGVDWPLRVGSAFPRFHDIYSQSGVSNSYGYLDARGGTTLRETLAQALAAEVSIVQLVTWNDFGEGTVLEPTEEDGYYHLTIIQETVRSVRDLPFVSEDLEIPLVIYVQRRHTSSGTAIDLQLDQAVAFLMDGDAASARATLDALSATDVEPLQISESLTLGPNPSDGTVTLFLETPVGGAVVVTAYDALGRQVAELANDWFSAGSHEVAWNAETVTPGVYFVRTTVGRAVVTKPVVIR
ncbi:MAG: hypothetical protein ACI84D_001192 [Thalassolituus oleivorans]|jgi:hypothetical protein